MCFRRIYLLNFFFRFFGVNIKTHLSLYWSRCMCKLASNDIIFQAKTKVKKCLNM